MSEYRGDRPSGACAGVRAVQLGVRAVQLSDEGLRAACGVAVVAVGRSRGVGTVTGRESLRAAGEVVGEPAGKEGAPMEGQLVVLGSLRWPGQGGPLTARLPGSTVPAGCATQHATRSSPAGRGASVGAFGLAVMV